MSNSVTSFHARATHPIRHIIGVHLTGNPLNYRNIKDREMRLMGKLMGKVEGGSIDMRKKMTKKITLMLMTVALLGGSVMPLMADSDPQITSKDAMAKKIRKELVTLPYFSVFDNLAFKVEENTVTLYGQVSRPSLKSSAERVVEKIKGVEDVVNKIEVLPLSPMDDRIRIATYRAIYSQVGLDRLALAANPPIHIIVRNGHVTLEGVVNSKSDSTRALMAANGVSNVFSVTNNLRIEKN